MEKLIIEMQNIAANVSVYLPWLPYTKTLLKGNLTSFITRNQLQLQTSCFTENRQDSTNGDYETVSSWWAQYEQITKQWIYSSICLIIQITFLMFTGVKDFWLCKYHYCRSLLAECILTFYWQDERLLSIHVIGNRGGILFQTAGTAEPIDIVHASWAT